jgi:hypothetical protein
MLGGEAGPGKAGAAPKLRRRSLKRMEGLGLVEGLAIATSEAAAVGTALGAEPEGLQ